MIFVRMIASGSYHQQPAPPNFESFGSSRVENVCEKKVVIRSYSLPQSSGQPNPISPFMETSHLYERSSLAFYWFLAGILTILRFLIAI